MTLTTAEVADLLGIEAHDVERLMADGFLEFDAGGIALAAAIRGYVRALRDEAQRASASAAAIRLQAARTRAIELRSAGADGRALDLGDSQEVFLETLGAWKSKLLSLPARIGGSDMQARGRIEDAINTALTGIADEFENAVEPT